MVLELRWRNQHRLVFAVLLRDLEQSVRMQAVVLAQSSPLDTRAVPLQSLMLLLVLVVDLHRRHLKAVAFPVRP